MSTTSVCFSGSFLQIFNSFLPCRDPLESGNCSAFHLPVAFASKPCFSSFLLGKAHKPVLKTLLELRYGIRCFSSIHKTFTSCRRKWSWFGMIHSWHTKVGGYSYLCFTQRVHRLIAYWFHVFFRTHSYDIFNFLATPLQSSAPLCLLLFFSYLSVTIPQSKPNTELLLMNSFSALGKKTSSDEGSLKTSD